MSTTALTLDSQLLELAKEVGGVCKTLSDRITKTEREYLTSQSLSTDTKYIKYSTGRIIIFTEVALTSLVGTTDVVTSPVRVTFPVTFSSPPVDVQVAYMLKSADESSVSIKPISLSGTSTATNFTTEFTANGVGDTGSPYLFIKIEGYTDENLPELVYENINEVEF